MLVLHLCLGWNYRDVKKLPECVEVLAELKRLKDASALGCHVTGNIYMPTNRGQFVCVYTYRAVKYAECQDRCCRHKCCASVVT